LVFTAGVQSNILAFRMSHIKCWKLSNNSANTAVAIHRLKIVCPTVG
jgi:hypothetical protein